MLLGGEVGRVIYFVPVGLALLDIDKIRVYIPVVPVSVVEGLHCPQQALKYALYCISSLVP